MMTLNSLFCAAVPLSNCSLVHPTQEITDKSFALYSW